MSWTTRWRKRLRAVVRKEAVERELNEEIALHLQLETEKNISLGMAPEDARRQATLAFGGVERHKEEVREARVLGWIPGLSLDLRLGGRMLAKHPGLAVMGGLGMAVGVAISAVVFSILGTIIYPEIPLPEGERIVSIANFDAATGGDEQQTHLHDLSSWRAQLSAVAELGAYRIVNRNLIARQGPAEALRVVEITASGFRITRVAPILGRYLVDDDERQGALPVVVIGFDVWQDRFASDPEVVGRTLHLDGEPHAIVGVMPEGFAFPVNNRIWTPLRLDPLDYEDGAAPSIAVFGRLASGATLDGAQAQLTVIGNRTAAARPDTHEHIRPTIVPYSYSFLDVPSLIWVLQLARFLIGALLVVIAVNVSILVYARTATRAGEIAIRIALGASRRRVVAQIFCEAFVLSLLAAVIGLAAAHVILLQMAAFFARMGGEQLPYWWDISLTPASVGYVAALSVVGAAVVGVLPALKATRPRVQAQLREMSGGTGMRMGRTWTALIALQVAVAVALTPVVAVIPLRELLSVSSPPPPVPLEEIVAAPISMDRLTPPAAEASPYDEALHARFEDRAAELVQRLQAERGVAGVAFASGTPGGGAQRFVELDSAAVPAATGSRTVHSLELTPGVFDLFGARLLAGRAFENSDLTAKPTSVVVNQSFVQAVLAGGAPLGRRFQYTRRSGDAAAASAGGERWYEIVGVVDDFPLQVSSPEEEAAVYHPAAAPNGASTTVLLRIRGIAPEAFLGRIRENATAVDPALRLGRVLTIAEYLRLRVRPERILEWAMAALVASVLLLSAGGIHALVSLTVSQRRREIGVRVALGAKPGRLLRTIIARAMRQISLGVALGGLLATALILDISSTGIRAAALLVAVAAGILVVSLFAVLAPARKALLIQPMEALREE